MSLDLTTLRLLKRRDRYEKLSRAVPKKALDARTGIILDDFGRFFRENPEAAAINPDAFKVMFSMIHGKISDEDMAVYSELFKKIAAEDVPPDVEAGLMKRLVSAATAADIAELIIKFHAGDEFDLKSGVQALMDDYDKQIEKKVKNPQVLDPIEELLAAEKNDTGLHWPLASLNRHIKPLVGGDFVVIAARPDKGKTSFVAHLATHMAAQVDGLYPGERRSGLWFNNEGPGKRIVTRCFQSALNATMEELVAKSEAGTIRSEYAAAMGGRGGTLRIFDIHDMWNYEVQELIELHNPAFIIFDMVDNIKFGGDANNNGQRTDQLLEAMYQWARMMAVKYDCPIIATSQISADGDGIQFPTLPMLKDSKTGKQGAADVILTIGALNDPMMERSRYLGTTKNKKVRTGVKASPQQEVLFDGDRGRYVEFPQ